MAEEVVRTETEITDDDKLWALLSYILCPLVGVIALLIEDKRARPFIKYNAVISIILGVLTIIFSSVCIGIFIWFYAIYLGIKSYQGEWVEVPVLSDFVRNQGWA